MATDPRALESLLAFWRDAGVDTAYAEAPVDRTAQSARATVTPATQVIRVPEPQMAADSAADVGAAASEAARLAAGAPDLTALAEVIAGFEGCPLKRQGARQAVFSRGPIDALVMIIGEAPGGEEDIQGAPFVGKAGKLLDRMLAAAGLEEQTFITNTVYWRPPGNRTPTAAEQKVCAPFVERAIALVKPKLLLFVGAAATGAMLQQKGGILSLRGRWFNWRSSDGSLEIPALPTLHPAFLLRTPSAKKMAWQDLLTLTERLEAAPNQD
jgi:uracil-DNA glycosylase family 4